MARWEPLPTSPSSSEPTSVRTTLQPRSSSGNGSIRPGSSGSQAEGIADHADASLDDAWTGTLPYLSRAQVALNARGDEATTESHAELLNKHGKHQAWHDLESLCYCVLFKTFERWRYLPPVRTVLDAVYANAPYRVAYRWLDQHASDLRDAVRGCKAQLKVEEPKLADEVKKGFDLLVTGFKAKIVPADGAESEKELETLIRTLASEDDQLLFLAVVEAAIDMVRQLYAIETGMEQRPDGHIPRNRRVSRAPAIEAGGVARRRAVSP